MKTIRISAVAFAGIAALFSAGDAYQGIGVRDFKNTRRKRKRESKGYASLTGMSTKTMKRRYGDNAGRYGKSPDDVKSERLFRKNLRRENNGLLIIKTYAQM